METDASRRIVITGTFCSLNKGDAAMRIALSTEIRKAIPNCYVVIMTPFPELDYPAYNGSAIFRCSRRQPRKAIALILQAAAWRALHRVFGGDQSWILNDELEAYHGSDLIVDLSGDGLTEEYGVKCLISHLVPIALGRLFHKPVFVCAQTIGPLQKTRALCSWLLRNSDKVTAREYLTLDYLSSLGFMEPHLSLAADMAFLMEPAAPQRAREILAAEGVRFDKPLIGFSVSRLPGHMLGSPALGKPLNWELEIAKTLDKVVSMGFTPVMVSHVTGPGENRDDRRTAMRIADLAEHGRETVVLPGDYAAEEIKAIIGQMDLFVGVRMHSCIAALSMGVPTISIAYGPKAFGIMDLAGQRDWAVDIRGVTAEMLGLLVKDAWERRFSMRESLQMEMPRVRAMAGRNVEIIRQMLNGEPVSPYSGNE
ncbi:MAG: polysaccharide pyruvyl transferase family protein [Armatimonadota bacterium]|nr:polysaccharide pyruvyl transferase family protein [Armatimonadota bacterium]